MSITPATESNLDQRGTDIFIGREQELLKLHERLQQYDTVAISGMGGIGKTELAVQYARTHLEQKTYPGGVVWLKAREDVASQIVLFARSLPMPQPPDDDDPAAKAKFYWRNWQDAKTPVILDDVQDYGAIKSLLPVDPRFKILLTTRLTLQRPVKDFEIEVLSEETAIELLRAIVSDERLDQDLAIAKQICNWLGYLPLGIELVGRYLARRRDTSLAVLWQRLQDKRLGAKALKDATPEMTAPLGVAAAFELSWQELNEDAQQLTALLSLFALAEIPWTLVEACLPDEDSEALEDRRDESLLNLHLLERTGQGMYQLHQLLREFFAAKREQRADVEAMKQAFCRVIVTVGQQIPQTLTLTIIEQVTPAIPHLKEAATTLESWLTDEDLVTPATHLAWFYMGKVAYTEAERWSQHCRVRAEARFGLDHVDVANSLNTLARLYQLQGRYAEAEPLYTRSLDVAKRRLNSDHLNVASSFNNLGNLYQLQGRYAEAESLVMEALKIRKKHLRADHPAVAQSLNNLAVLYHLQERYAEAEPLYERTLDIDERHYGKNHPEVAMDLNNLAALYRSQRRYSKSESLYFRAVIICKQQLVANHPEMALSFSGLANLYQLQGRYAEAEPFYRWALATLISSLGEHHPNTQAECQNLLGFLRAVMEAGQTGQLSDHPATQDLLRQMREGSGE